MLSNRKREIRQCMKERTQLQEALLNAESDEERTDIKKKLQTLEILNVKDYKSIFK